jgi:hypothetical protein
MKPELISSTNPDLVLQELIECISSIDCSMFSSVSECPKKQRVPNLQDVIKAELEKALCPIKWTDEHRPNSGPRDRVDIYGEGKGYVVVIELDTIRADQIAKKFVSRMAILPDARIYYLCVCYPGTKSMNEQECKKYFGFCQELARRLGNSYAGFIIG